MSVLSSSRVVPDGSRSFAAATRGATPATVGSRGDRVGPTGSDVFTRWMGVLGAAYCIRECERELGFAEGLHHDALIVGRLLANRRSPGKPQSQTLASDPSCLVVVPAGRLTPEPLEIDRPLGSPGSETKDVRSPRQPRGCDSRLRLPHLDEPPVCHEQAVEVAVAEQRARNPLCPEAVDHPARNRLVAAEEVVVVQKEQ